METRLLQELSIPRDYLHLPLLRDYIAYILEGSDADKALLRQHYFKIANTPKWFKGLGLIGDVISVRYGVVARHRNKDIDHHLNIDQWLYICDNITRPKIIARYKDGYTLYLDTPIEGRYIRIGIDIASYGRGLYINAVRTVFYTSGNIGDIVYLRQ